MEFAVAAMKNIGDCKTSFYNRLNEINIPDDFSVENANTVKVMVWDGFDSIKPLFEAYEESVDRLLKAEN